MGWVFFFCGRGQLPAGSSEGFKSTWVRDRPVTQAQTDPLNVLYFPSYRLGVLWGVLMSKAQKYSLGLLYGAIAILGAAYGFFEHPHTINSLVASKQELTLHMGEILPLFLLLILALMVCGLVRATGSVLDRLNGTSLAAHSTLHTNYEKARIQTI